MGELDRLGCMLGNNWIWIIVIFFILCNPCILEQIQCLFSNFGGGSGSCIIIILILFCFCGRDMMGC